MGFIVKLHLGVLDVAYDYNDSTTGSVAEKLEKDYGIMEYFAVEKSELINKALEKDFVDFIDDALSGKPIRSEPFKSSCQTIERLFRQALTAEFMNGSNFRGRPVPTRAALMGISHRFKGKKNKRGVRPSFIDTGAYRQSFKTWVEL
jgi:hypothetical protein